MEAQTEEWGRGIFFYAQDCVCVCECVCVCVCVCEWVCVLLWFCTICYQDWTWVSNQFWLHSLIGLLRFTELQPTPITPQPPHSAYAPAHREKEPPHHPAGKESHQCSHADITKKWTFNMTISSEGTQTRTHTHTHTHTHHTQQFSQLFLTLVRRPGGTDFKLDYLD